MIIVLNYHSVGDFDDIYTIDSKKFTDQMIYLKKKFKIVPIRELVNNDNENRVGITFDDGFLDNLEVVLPIIENLCIPITIFVTTGCLNKKFIGKQMLSENDVRKLYSSKYVTIGSHSINHVYYRNLSKEETKIELEKSKDQLEKIIGDNISEFAYPNGYGNKYSSEIVGDKYNLAFEGAGIICDYKIDKKIRMSIPRVLITKNIPDWKFRFMMTKYYWILKKYYDKYRNTNV